MDDNDAVPFQTTTQNKRQNHARQFCDRCSTMGCYCSRQQQSPLPTSGVLYAINTVRMPEYAPTAFQNGWSRQERTGFEFFRLRTAPSLPGVVQTGPEAVFWSQWLLQAVLYDTALKHATCALGSLHQALSQRPQPTDYDVTLFAYEQHAMAIKMTMVSMQQDRMSLDISLVICILLTVFERLTGNIKTAITHLQAGIRLAKHRKIDVESIRARKQAFPHPVHLPRSILQILLQRLERQLVGLNQPFTQHDGLKFALDARSMPYRFYSFTDAESALEEVLNTITHDATLPKNHVGPLPSPKAQRTLVAFKQWSAALEAFLRRSKVEDVAINGNNQSIVLTLRTWQTIFRILTSRDIAAGEMGFDVFKDDFAAVLRFSAAIIRVECSRVRPNQHSVSSEQHRPSFNAVFRATNCSSDNSDLTRPMRPMPESKGNILSTKEVKPGSRHRIQREQSRGLLITLSAFSPVSALCTVAHHCRDPAIRRSAIHLLDTCDWENGLFNSETVVLCVERIMQLEESGALTSSNRPASRCPIVKAEQIPLEHRCDFVQPLLIHSHKFQVDFLNTKNYALLEETGACPDSTLETFHGEGLVRETWEFPR